MNGIAPSVLSLGERERCACDEPGELSGQLRQGPVPIGVMKKFEKEPYCGQAIECLRVLQKIVSLASLLEPSRGLLLQCAGTVLPCGYELTASLTRAGAACVVVATAAAAASFIVVLDVSVVVVAATVVPSSPSSSTCVMLLLQLLLCRALMLLLC